VKYTIASPLCVKLGKIRKAFGNILNLLLAGCNLLFIGPDPFPVGSDLQLVGRDVLLVDLDVLLVNPDRLLCWEQASLNSLGGPQIITRKSNGLVHYSVLCVANSVNGDLESRNQGRKTHLCLAEAQAFWLLGFGVICENNGDVRVGRFHCQRFSGSPYDQPAKLTFSPMSMPCIDPRVIQHSSTASAIDHLRIP